MKGFLCILELCHRVGFVVVFVWACIFFFFFKEFEDNAREARLGISFQELPPVFVL